MAVMLEPLVQNLEFVNHTDLDSWSHETIAHAVPCIVTRRHRGRPPIWLRPLAWRVLLGGCLLFIVTMLSFWVGALVETVEARHCVAHWGQLCVLR